MPNLFHAVFATLADPAKKLDGAATLKTLQAALKKDDSLPNLGYAFQVTKWLSIFLQKAKEINGEKSSCLFWSLCSEFRIHLNTV